ncbi:DUF3040 domain-containing protein [Nonomuraea pusilla]|uniref:DUF3040 domain-containing protein n=1 Tax=Nonomuraea pusilla TaxID=46177 RepID=A0A1H7NIY2_9ACTN|nr:DUF3040 domain-containing protein [Nonomuraea pusilla]SEL23344.1 Protein of unknown function [Nonomuraea pusilla]
MGLSAREQAVLEAIARRLKEDDPALVKRLSAFGARRAEAACSPSSHEGWPVALIAVCLAVFALVLLLSGSGNGLTNTSIR